VGEGGDEHSVLGRSHPRFVSLLPQIAAGYSGDNYRAEQQTAECYWLYNGKQQSFERQCGDVWVRG
jgi:hypothetical protein